MIKNYRALIDKFPKRRYVLDILEEGILSADPYRAVMSNVKIVDDNLVVGDRKYPLSSNIVVIGAGKASGRMAEAIWRLLGNRISRGIVIVPMGIGEKYKTGRIVVGEASHPEPSEKGVILAGKIMEIVENLDKDDIVICLISGGGSALMTYPAEDISLEDMVSTTRYLLKSGATIDEINCVRKHISRVKGGQLAEKIYPAKTISLIVSDVVGDRLDTIASGPTAPDNTSFHDAKKILLKYNLWDKIPSSVRERIEKGVKGIVKETPKPGDKIFENVLNFIVASNRISLKAMARKAGEMGFNTIILSSRVQGEARHVGRMFASICIESSLYGDPVKPPACIIMGGETTVTVKGGGKGGRNQELVLSSLKDICGFKNIIISSIGSDGIDGITDAAGAIADRKICEEVSERKLDIDLYLKNNDSYSFFKEI
ncbi:MAG TPA: glycerate kinase, partial [Thermoprotei archaeon]|nr:glycerate kinase [Thermoprotei archaeon]